MTRRLFILFLFITIPLYNVKPAAAFYSEPVFFTQEGDYFLHTVEQGQTVYSIARMYNVQEEAVYRLNPGSRESIQTGAQLKIPQESGSYFYHTIQPKETLYSVSRMYQMKGEDIVNANPGLSIETFSYGKVIRIPTNRVTTPMTGPSEDSIRKSTNALLSASDPPENIPAIRMALLLPFAANASMVARMVEYYEGFLLALEDIKKQGISVVLQVYDIGEKTDRLPSILKKPEMRQVDIIFGGLSEKQIRMIANFSREWNIPYVIPFNSRSDEPMTYATVYQISTPPSYMYSKASSAFCDRYRDATIVFHVPSASGNRMDFIQVVQKDLKAKNIPYQVLTDEEITSSDVLTLLSETKNTVFVPSDDGPDALSKMVVPLRVALDLNPQMLVSLFGYPAWQASGTDYLSDLFRFNATFFSVYYANVTSAKYKTFYNNYIHWYSKELINVYPKFGLLGYDTGMFFIQALNRYGSALAPNIDQLNYSGIQMDFNFERVNNWGGFINTNLYLVDFRSDGTITSHAIK
ncbi:MAG: LysM peptidoglycan-binding domain-containing protein [Dysgonamonadaceae bacterium]|jgi:LysM repeat protein|nr:LysM peptidoglycan-binding domain-containing protein [Dysgonamonadaceae bacterium]